MRQHLPHGFCASAGFRGSRLHDDTLAGGKGKLTSSTRTEYDAAGPAAAGSGWLSGTQLGKNAPPIVEGVLFLAVIVVMALIAVGVRRDEERWLGRARWFGRVLAAETVFYVGSAVAAVLVLGGVSELADEALGLIALALVNAPIGWLGWRIAMRQDLPHGLCASAPRREVRPPPPPRGRLVPRDLPLQNHDQTQWVRR